MTLGLFSRWTGKTASRPTPRFVAPPAFRPRLEGFEERVVPAAPVLAAAQAASVNVAPTFNLNVLNLNVGDVSILANNTLGAVASIGNVIQNIPITLSTSPAPAGADCPILHLQLSPIHLDLLGLNVDTSAICLDITAHHGEGLLGDLLCGVANLLNGGLNIGDILNGVGLPLLGLPGLTTGQTGQIGQLVTGLGDLLGQVFDSLPLANILGVGNSQPGRTDILNLSLGPVNLNLLGLEVNLDNCADGPVTVDITAESGPGKLLGNLLGGLSGLLNGPGNGGALARRIDRIEAAIGDILAANP